MCFHTAEPGRHRRSLVIVEVVRPFQAQAEKRSKLPVRLKTRGTGPKVGPSPTGFEPVLPRKNSYDKEIQRLARGGRPPIVLASPYEPTPLRTVIRTAQADGPVNHQFLRWRAVPEGRPCPSAPWASSRSSVTINSKSRARKVLTFSSM